MATKETSRKQLSERWSEIEQQVEEDAQSSTHPIRLRRLRQLKEQWFSDAFSFLINLSKENHVWCGYWDIMGPLLETFFNYFKEERHGSPLKLLWNRISEEMKCCTLCIHQHHQAQEMYATEYDKSCVNPLLDVLHILDEGRVTQHLKDLNTRIVKREYDPAHDNGEVVSILFEVLTFPILLDDQSLAYEFQIFIEAIDNSHELKLDGNQQYPGVYVMLFLKGRKARSIGLRLAGLMGNLRRSTDLDPLQHLIKKCICILETENTESAIEASRPRVQLDRITVWLGMKALVGFLEPAAFEEGILDRYPVFLSVVLNNISDDSLESSHAVNCMRLLFEKLGCKLWLRAALSPSVMRNTLLGQCFHTRNEKSHKEIFDLFRPFLQSLESLQDGEHEKQRRHFLYFLLHQVPVSSNFSILMKKKASQIAVLIVLRGYSMDPPSPPAECAHMWGPSIVSSLKDLLLHSSLRQPAIALIQTVIISDASAFLSLIMSGQFHSGTLVIPNHCEDDGEEGILSALDINERDASCWKEFSLQHKMISQVDGSWMCAPMLWFDVFTELDPSILPLSFSKAVFWALSRFSLIEPENSTVMALSLENWLATCASEISYLFGWKIPSGCEDGGDGTESKNSISISTMCLPLVRTFKRLMTHYVVRMEQGQLRKQWTWEPMISDSLILLLVDPNDSARQVARLILEQVSDVRGLTSGLQFLCSTPLSLSALLLGLRHALKLVQLDIVLLNFQTLHHLFFILSKLLKEGNSSVQTVSLNLSAVSDFSKLSMQGGFLKQPLLDSSTTDCDEYPSILSSTSWEKFASLLSQVTWPAIVKCLDGGKTFIDHTASQMICIRLLEVIPVVFERLPRNYGTMVETLDNLKWLHDLVDWGKSSLAVLVRYWKQTLASLLGLIKASCSIKSASVINDIKKLIFDEKISKDEVSKQVAFLSIALLNDSRSMKSTGLKSKHSASEDPLDRRTCSVDDSENLIFDEAKASVIDSEALIRQGHAIILSDDEEVQISETYNQPSQSTTLDGVFGASAAGRMPCSDLKENYFSNHDCSMGSPETCHQLSSSHTINLITEKMTLEPMGGNQSPVSLVKSGPSGGKTKGEKSSNSSLSQDTPDLKNSFDEFTNSKQFDSDASKLCSNDKAFSDMNFSSASKVQHSLKKSFRTSDRVIKQVVCDTNDDLWQFSFFKPSNRQQVLTAKPSDSSRKRQVIQLALPVENKSGFKRLGGEVKRFNIPRLDDWYRTILKSDFFVDVGLTSGSDNDCQNSSILKKIPVCFQSPDEYEEIFRPLILEELKAQLQNSFQEVSSAEEMRCGSLSVLSVERIDDFHIVRFTHDETDSTGSKTLLENDLILLTKQPLQNSAGDVHAIGKVDRRDRESRRRLNIIVIRLYMQGCPRLNRARKLLTERSKWYVSRIMNITTQLREFQALSSIREIPLIPIILNPVNQPCFQYESRTGNFSKLSQPMQQIIRSSYNDSQLRAVSVAIGPFDKDFELTLIQGPPGTGKTRTIVAIISGLLAFSQVKDAKRLRNYGQVCVSSSSTNQRISQSAAIARSWQDAALARQLNEEAEKNNKIMKSCSRGRILICAQSNAAVDELVARISCEGLYGNDGLMYKPYLVRIGNAKTVHPNSFPFFIDTLVENRLKEEKGNKNDEKQSGTSADSLLIIRTNLEKLVDNIRYYEAKRANLQEGHSDSKNLVEGGYPDTVELSDAELKEKLRKLYEMKKTLYADLVNIQARERKASDEIRTLRHKFRTNILKEAEIVVTTLSGCGGDLYGVCSESISGHNFNYSFESSLFDAVVIDEAAQALEPATLIPLQLLKSRGTKCIMVGDPKQLPATVMSTVANKYLFQCSMFERLQRAGHPVIMLTQQYRMHPEICRFPSSHFYEGKLLNGDQMFGKAASFHETLCLGPYVLFDILDGQETRGKNAASVSIYNECESDAAVEVLQYFKKRYPSEFLARKIGVITPYKCQLSLLRSRFSSAFGSSVTAEIEFNTVDGFQGREVDILLLSTVRAAGSSSQTTGIGSGSLGFVADVRRMNVALTRAKLSLWIFGNARTLQTNLSWAALLEDARHRNLIVSGRKPYSSIFRSTLETRSNSGNVTSISGELELVESSRAVSSCVNTKKRIMKHSAERKRKHNDAVSDIACTIGKDISHAAEDAAKNKKNRVRYGMNVPLEKVVATATVPDRDNEVLKDAKSIVVENQESTDKTSEKQISAVKARDSDYVSSHFTNSGKVCRSQKQLKPISNEMCVETIKHDMRQQKVKAGTSHSEISFKEQDEKGVSDRGEILTDSFAKRRQQRKAVDALLSSALVSSKKSDSIRKEYSKRTTSTSKDNLVRPQKPRKG